MSFAQPEYGDRFSVLRFVTAALREWRSFVAAETFCIVLAVLWLLIGPKTFTSTVAFSPQVGSGSAIRGLAAQLGFEASGADQGQSTDFYSELLRSNRLLGGVAEHVYSVDRSGAAAIGTLPEVLGYRSDSARNRAKAIRYLRKVVVVTSSRRSGLVTVRASAENGRLAAEIASAALAEVIEFNQVTRQSRAGAERSFIEKRLAESRAELERAEAVLEKFVLDNRLYVGSPALMLQHDRLARQVALRQSVVSSLAGSYEQARIDEVRDTPVLTVMQGAEVPVEADWRPLFTMGLALVLGFALTVGIGLARRMFEDASRSDPETLDEIARYFPAVVMRRILRRSRD